MTRWIELEYGGSLSKSIEEIESYAGGSQAGLETVIPSGGGGGSRE